MRDFSKKIRTSESERQRTRRINDMMHGIAGYMLGEGIYSQCDSLATALSWSGSRIRMDEHTKKLCRRLDTLAAIIKETTKCRA